MNMITETLENELLFLSWLVKRSHSTKYEMTKDQSKKAEFQKRKMNLMIFDRKLFRYKWTNSSTTKWDKNVKTNVTNDKLFIVIKIIKFNFFLLGYLYFFYKNTFRYMELSRYLNLWCICINVPILVTFFLINYWILTKTLLFHILDYKFGKF